MTDGKLHSVKVGIVSILLLTCIVTAEKAHAANEASTRHSFSVEAARSGDAIKVSVRATVKAPLALIWSTLTDYDHLAQFIPSMKKSRLVERLGNVAVIEQSGYAHLWFFHFPIDVTVEVTEHPSFAIQVRLLKGNLKRLEGHYEIEKIGEDLYVLRWSGTIEPGIAVPSFLATDMMRKNISEQFLGMVNEIERRAAITVPTSPHEQETPAR